MSRSKRVRKARSAARREKRLSVRLDVARAHLAEATERARFRRELNESDAPDALKKVLGFLADPIGSLVEEMGKRPMCELCIDPIDKPYVDEYGGKHWRCCTNTATRQVLDEKGRTLNICEEHFKAEAS